MNSYTEILTESALIKDFGSFKKEDWLIFSDYDNELLEKLTKDRHSIQAKWETRSKFAMHMLTLSFRYENDSNCAIIEATKSFSLEGNPVLLTTQIHLPKCLIDRSYYNNNIQPVISDTEYELIELYKRMFKKNSDIRRKSKFLYAHNVDKYEMLEIDNNNQIDYTIQYAYYDSSNINTAMGIKGYYYCVSTTGDDDFEEKLTKMIEDRYTLPLLNKKLNELTDDDILVLEMNNT